MVDQLSVHQHALRPLVRLARELAPGARRAGAALGAFYLLSPTTHATIYLYKSIISHDREGGAVTNALEDLLCCRGGVLARMAVPW